MCEIPTTASNDIIFKTENFFSIFNEFLESTQNFSHFEKKD